MDVPDRTKHETFPLFTNARVVRSRSMNDSAETRRRILDETIRVIEAEGDPAVRVAKVAHAAGVTQGMVTYHFRTRSRLIAEAHAERFAATMNDDIAVATEAVKTITTREQAADLIANLTRAVVSSIRAEARRTRMSVLGYAITNAELAEQVTVIQTRLFDEFTTVFEIAQERGVIRSDISPRAIVTLVSAYSLGLVLSDFDRNASSPDELADGINALMSGVLAG